MKLQVIKKAAEGRWLEIIQSLCPQLNEATKRPGSHVRCPCHGKRDGFRLFSDAKKTGGGCCNLTGAYADGFSLLMWGNSWTFPKTVDEVASYLGLRDGTCQSNHQEFKPTLAKEQKDWSREKLRLQVIWEGSKQDTGRIQGYFRSRGILLPVPQVLRLHPNLLHYHQGQVVKYPAILAKIIRNGEVVGLHLIYLDSDGSSKALCSKPKKNRKCSDSMSGGAIRLFEPKLDEPLVLAEGIETSLSIHQMTKLPVWSCISSTFLEKVQLPDSVREVYIGADKDRSGTGQRAAERLGKRLIAEGRTVKIALPPWPIPQGQKSFDWNDVLMQEVARDR